MSAPQSGLLLTQQTNYNVDNSYFLKVGDALVQPTLVSTVSIQGNPAEGGLAVPAKITVPGTTHVTPAYVGSMKLVPGGNAAAPASSNGVVIRAAAGPSTVMEIGTDGEGPNQLLIAGASGPSQVNDNVYNPALYVFGAPSQSPTQVDAINNATQSKTFRTISLGNIPAGYNFYQVWLDLNTTIQSDMAGGVPRVRFYLTDSVNGAYDNTKAITSWTMPASFPTETGSALVLSDVPLIFYGVPTGRNLYIGMTFATEPIPDSNANIQNPVTDYSLISQPSKAV